MTDPTHPAASARLPIRRPEKLAALNDPIDSGYQITLLHDDGTYYSPIEPFTGTRDKCYPRLASTPVSLSLIKSGGGRIRSGDTVTIESNEPLNISNDQRVFLGAWSTPALYYWSEGWEKENWTIYRVAGDGDIAYGDRVYFINQTYNQRMGRDSERLYLTTSESFTDTFTIGAPWDPPLITSVLPLDQYHSSTGKPEYRDILGWVWKKENPGDYMFNITTPLPKGDYSALIQFRHDRSDGGQIATVRVYCDNELLDKVIIYGESFDSDDWQRSLILMTIPHDGQVTVDVIAADDSFSLETGAIFIQPVGQRPFWAIAHRCNTIDNLIAAAQAGANAIEFDISPELVDGDIVYWIHHSGQPTWVKLEDYLQAVKDNNILDTMAMLMFDIKPDDKIDAYNYGYYLAVIATRYGIGANQAFFSVEEAAMADSFYQGVADAGMAGARDVSLIKEGPSKETDPSIWYRVGTANGATFLGIGVFAKDIFSPMRDWLAPMSYNSNLRDRDQVLKKTYFWTLDSGASMKKTLDLGMDAIIVNDVTKLLSVLSEAPYNLMFRLATKDDSQTEVFGWPVKTPMTKEVIPAIPPCIGLVENPA